MRLHPAWPIASGRPTVAGRPIVTGLRESRPSLPFEPLDLERVRGHLAATTRFTDIELLDVTDSTNRVVVDRAAAGAPEGLVVAADLQTAGRGRLDRTWEAEPGTSLLVSILLRPSTCRRPVAPAHRRRRPGRPAGLRAGGRVQPRI